MPTRGRNFIIPASGGRGVTKVLGCVIREAELRLAGRRIFKQLFVVNFLWTIMCQENLIGAVLDLVLFKDIYGFEFCNVAMKRFFSFAKLLLNYDLNNFLSSYLYFIFDH